MPGPERKPRNDEPQKGPDLAPINQFSHCFYMKKASRREFSVLVERDTEGYYVASVPELPGCHTQARSLDKLMERVREAIALCLEVEASRSTTEFIGVQRSAV
jgi:predicted RNase H-like HicB family nuclease